jgi:tetratricopeptide (TPR) repeat protein
MNRLTYIFVLVAAFVSLNALALAQGNNASDPAQSRLWTELELTDQAIERAREAIQKASSSAAAAALEQAVELQKQAWERYQARQPLAALQLTRRAREKAKLALANGRIAEQNEGTVLRELERVEQLLDRASEQVGESARVGNVQSMIDMARNNLDKAWELYRAEQYRPALKLTNQAETALRKVVSLLERQSTQTANFERRLVTVEETYRRVQEGLSDCESEQARRLMEQARTMLSQAHELALNGQYDAALRSLKNAQDKAQSALRECRNPDVLQTRHDQIAAQVKRFSERVPAGDNATRRLLDQAWEQLRQAQQQIRAGNLESAAASLRAAQLLLTQAQERFDWDNL